MSAASESARSDEELVRAAREGDARAFDELLERHQARVLRVLRLMGVRLQDREDVAQDVLVRVFRHLGSYRRGRPFRSWIYRIAVNAAHDYRARRVRIPGEAPADERLDEPVDASGPGEAADRRELRLRLVGALERLSDRERAVFVLRELEELDTRTVARTLGISAVTVRRHLGLARRRLRTVLGDPAKKTTSD